MSRINEKLGIAPQTRTRQATHSTSLVSAARCPKCHGRHVIENQVAGRRRRLCGFCSHTWEPEQES